MATLKNSKLAEGLDEEQLAELREAFTLFDKDNNGVISMDEFRGVLQSLGQEPTDDELQVMMRSVDTDRNGVVDFDEFVQMMRTHLHQPGAEPTAEEELREVFQVFDKDKDGFISFEELKLAMINLGERMTNEELKAMMTAADTDAVVTSCDNIVSVPSNFKLPGDPWSKAAKTAKTAMSKIPAFWEDKYKKEAAKNWNLFYKRNEDRFFKDRHWIGREFPELFHPDTSVVVEVGCGVGNFALPLLTEQETLSHLYACDFSEKAIEILKSDERYDTKRCTTFVADLTKPGSLQETVPVASADIVTSIFVLSALPPEKFSLAVENVKAVLKDGGLWLIRDYAVNDAAQLRFKEDRKISDSLFVRQDGTLSYFFSKEELQKLAEDHGFQMLDCDYVQSKTTNVKKELDLDRTFVQARFRLIKN